MNVYVISTEDNLPAAFTSETVAVYDSSQKAKAQIKADFDKICAECSNGKFMPKYFKEYITKEYDGCWEIRSKKDSDIYISEYVEEFEVK